MKSVLLSLLLSFGAAHLAGCTANPDSNSAEAPEADSVESDVVSKTSQRFTLNGSVQSDTQDGKSVGVDEGKGRFVIHVRRISSSALEADVEFTTEPTSRVTRRRVSFTPSRESSNYVDKFHEFWTAQSDDFAIKIFINSDGTVLKAAEQFERSESMAASNVLYGANVRWQVEEGATTRFYQLAANGLASPR